MLEKTWHLFKATEGGQLTLHFEQRETNVKLDDDSVTKMTSMKNVKEKALVEIKNAISNRKNSNFYIFLYYYLGLLV